MKILIISDNHGNMRCVDSVLKQEKDINMLIHCGDGGSTHLQIENKVMCICHAVAGNCDYGSSLPYEKEFKIRTYRAFVTHGHRYGVNYSTDRLFYLAKENGYDMVFFGHTHVPYVENREGVWLVNPGSIAESRTYPAKNTYAVMTIDDNGLTDVIIKSITPEK